MNNRPFRILALVAIASSTVATLWACSTADCSEDSTCAAPTKPNADGSTSADGSSTSDSSSNNTVDGGSDQDGSPVDGQALAHPKIVFINGVVATGPQLDSAASSRLCFAKSAKANPTDGDFSMIADYAMPSDASITDYFAYPGVGKGRGFVMGERDFESFTVRPYLLNAKSMSAKNVVGQAGPNCDALFSDGGVSGGLSPNNDYWRLNDLPPGTFKNGKKYFLALTGCTSDEAPNGSFQDHCGKTDNNDRFVTTGSPGPGNLRMMVVEVDLNTTVASDEIGVQVVHLSAIEDSFVEVNPLDILTPTMFNGQFFDGGNGASANGNVFPLTTGPLPFDRKVPMASPVVKLKGVVTATAGITHNMNGKDPQYAQALNNTVANPYPDMPLKPQAGSVQYVTTGTLDASTSAFVNGHVYTFAFLGWSSEFSNHLAHFIAFENK